MRVASKLRKIPGMGNTVWKAKSAMGLKERCHAFTRLVQWGKSEGVYPYFQSISSSHGPEVEIRGRRLIMVASNDYLGLSHDPRVIEAAAEALRRWGTGVGGSRFLCGNLAVHEVLEARLAEWVGKKKAIVHSTGFGTNLGMIGSLSTRGDVVLCDREDHASIFEGCRSSGARIIPFAHNDAHAAASALDRVKQSHPQASLLLATEGIFSMSGDIAMLPQLIRLKEKHPDLLFYLDDAHGLGVLGEQGRGTAHHFGLAGSVDFIMGTFSKAFASIGGFLAGDDEEVLQYLRHHSQTMIFSAGLPAACAATVLACLDILRSEPEHLNRLWEIVRKVREGYESIGLITHRAATPILPILVGEEEKAYRFATSLLENGIFAPPAVYPAVPRGRAIVRTVYTSAHEDRHTDHIMEVLHRLARQYRIGGGQG